MVKRIAVVLVILICQSAVAQISPEEAEARLKQKEAARAATSKPADDADQLRKMIHDLQAQIADLKDQNAKLTRQVVDLKKQVPPPNKPNAGTPGIFDPKVKIKIGMTLDQAIVALGPIDRSDEHGSGTKSVSWAAYTYEGTASGGFGGAGISLGGGAVHKRLVREIDAQVDSKGIITDFTDSQ